MPPNSKYCELKEEIIKKACVELIDLKRIEDAMILKTIHSLSMNPTSLVLLTYESISFKGVLKYWDDKSMSFEEFQLSKEMIQDFKYFKYFKNSIIQKDKLSIVDSKVSHNGKIIKGTFIFSFRATYITDSREDLEVNYLGSNGVPKMSNFWVNHKSNIHTNQNDLSLSWQLS